MRCIIPLVLYLAAIQHAAADAYRCDHQLFLVEAAQPELAERTCRSAALAREHLSSCGVYLDVPLRISVVETIEGAAGSCLGLYHCGEGQVEVLAPQAMAAARDTEGAFSRISDHALWYSVIVHELTHASYDRVRCPFASCIATSEYAAFAMQLSSLPANELERFGARGRSETKPSRDAISAMMYALSPDRFAELTWGHFSSRPDPCTYMGWIMMGNIIFDKERP
jgi:hypothetical protein